MGTIIKVDDIVKACDLKDPNAIVCRITSRTNMLMLDPKGTVVDSRIPFIAVTFRNGELRENGRVLIDPDRELVVLAFKT